MSLSINTNLAALTAHRNMVSTNKDMSTSLERLSTGLRINSAADDASGLTIADSLAAQADGLGQGIQNANDGVSIVQTADGALEESVSIVNTIKTKAIQAASDTQTTTTRSAIQEDIDKLMEELDSIATTTSYNGMQLLNGTYTNKVIQTGASANETSAISIGNTESDSIGHISTATLALDDENGGEVQVTITSAITGEDIELESRTIEGNNEEENGLGALADEINTVSSVTGVSALAVVESTTASAVQAGTTGSDFTINGIEIGAINVTDGDGKTSLVTAINDKTSETGISAAKETSGAITLTSDDGRVINVSGELNDVFGEGVTADDISTIGYITLTQEGSSQFNISGTGMSGLGTDVTANADYSNDSNVTLAAESTIASGSTLSEGTVIGADVVVVSADITDTLYDYELTSGSTLASGSVLDSGTVIGGSITLAAADAALDTDMAIVSGSTLDSGTIIGAGTVLTNTFSVGADVYESGNTLTSAVTLDADLTLSTNMTLSDASTLSSGSVLLEGTELGADITFTGTLTLTENMTLEAGSTIQTGSSIAAGSTIGDDTIVAAGASGGDISTTQETMLAEGSTLTTPSVIAEGSDLGGTSITTAETTLAVGESLTLEAGSTLASGTTFASGTTITQDMTLEDSGGTAVSVTAGTTITEDLIIQDDTSGTIVLSDELTLVEESTLATNSVVIFASESSDSVLSLSSEESLTLADLSVMTQEDAQIAITIADAALADLDSTRASLGSVQNQLTSTISNLSVTKTNVTASESTLRDVDFAEETANYARLSLLAQTSSYALSQANASSSNITSLLQ